MTQQRQMHLAVFWLGTGNHSAGWRMPNADFSNSEWSFVEAGAQLAERGREVGRAVSVRLEPGELVGVVRVVERAAVRHVQAPHLDAADGRAHSTLIYFLLEAGDVSHWHRVDAAEAWHWHAGSPIELLINHGVGTQALRLGPDLALGERPQAVVPARAWQAAGTLGDWTLVGCTVAPGFQFEGFELAPKGWEPG